MTRLARSCTYFDADGNLLEEKEVDVSWDEIRQHREWEFQRTDWWALKDLTMSQAKKDYRQFLRDMPQNFEDANAAADAWNEYEMPE